MTINDIFADYQVLFNVLQPCKISMELDIIIDKFMKMGYYRIAKTVFYKIRARDVVINLYIWNTMIGGYEEALRLF